MPFVIRRLTASSAKDASVWHTIGAICCRTASNRVFRNARDQELFTSIWIEPYEKLRPNWTYVAEVDGRVVGYLTGCPDSPAFSRKKYLRCTLPLVARIACGGYRGATRPGNFVRQAFGLKRSPESIFPSALKRELSAHYPAHLHMNVEPTHQKTGAGTALFQRYATDIEQAGISGIHVYCAAAPLPFYLRLNFKELGCERFLDAYIYLLGWRPSNL